MTPSLTIKWKLHCRSASRRGRINQWQCSTPGLAIGWFYRFCFRLRQPSFQWIISNGVVNGIGRNGNVLILPTPIPSSLWLRLRLRFSWLGHKVSYDSDYDSVACENQPIMSRTIAVHVRYNSWYISFSSSAKQQREMTKFCVAWRTWTTTANFLNFYFELNNVP